MQQKYLYDGPVESFGKCITQRWSGFTYADTERKARNNLTYQYKRRYGLDLRTRIKLPGELKTN